MNQSRHLPVVELLSRMVQINSVNANVSGNPDAEVEIALLLESQFLERGLKVRRMPTPGCDNLIATLEVKADLPWLMFESHMDTVTIAGMTIDPLAAEIRDGKMWGRGTCDTKGTGAAMIEAITRYAAGSHKPYNIAMACTVGEEFGMTGVRALAKGWDTLGFDPVGVIVGEPTNHQPIVAHNGAVRWNIFTHGVAAHSSTPHMGRSAISDMMLVVDCIESIYIPSLDCRDDLTGKAQCSVNMIQGGVQYNIIPEKCEIRIDRRIVPGEDKTQVLPAIDKLLSELAKKHTGLKFEQVLNFGCPPLTRQHNDLLVSHVQRVLTGMSLPTKAMGAPFCTDAGDLDEAGVPCVVMGPGDIAQAHTKDEFLALDQLEKGVEVYLALTQQPWQA